jgi:hypothetical protein
MSVEIGTTLPDHAVRFLQGGNTVVVATADAQGHPWSGVMSWVRAVDEQRVLLIVAAHARTLANVRETGRLMLQLLADGWTLGVWGRAEVVIPAIAGAPVPAAVVEMTVEGVKDDLTPGREFHAEIRSWWPEPDRQAVEDRGLTMLRELAEERQVRR